MFRCLSLSGEMRDNNKHDILERLANTHDHLATCVRVLVLSPSKSSLNQLVEVLKDAGKHMTGLKSIMYEPNLITYRVRLTLRLAGEHAYRSPSCSTSFCVSEAQFVWRPSTRSATIFN